MDEKALVSKAIYIMKAIAIITVAMAHCTYIDADIQRVTDIFGTIGVPVFLITGGLYYNNKKTWNVFLIEKLKRIVTPWLLWGCITYALHIINDHGSISFSDLLLWILGYKTWLYYVPVVLICYCIFRISTSTKFASIIVGVSLGSYVLTCVGMLNFNFMTSCQNPFNWLGFFAIGVILGNSGFRTCVFLLNKKTMMTIITGVLFVISGIGYYCFTKSIAITPSYWNCVSIWFELVSVAFVYYISIIIAEKCTGGIIVEIGKNSYPLFFTHMQIGINLVSVICMSIWNKMFGVQWAWITVIRGILVILLSYFVFVVLANRSLKLIKQERFNWIVGL